MQPVDGIIGPGVGPHDIELELPDGWDHAEFGRLADTIVRHSFRHAADTLRAMLQPTPNAAQLADEFAKRLGL
jgi:hypothetical protein